MYFQNYFLSLSASQLLKTELCSWFLVSSRAWSKYSSLTPIEGLPRGDGSTGTEQNEKKKGARADWVFGFESDWLSAEEEARRRHLRRAIKWEDQATGANNRIRILFVTWHTEHTQIV